MAWDRGGAVMTLRAKPCKEDDRRLRFRVSGLGLSNALGGLTSVCC